MQRSIWNRGIKIYEPIYLPRLKKNMMRKVQNMPIIDTFSDQSFDDHDVFLTVRESGGKKYFALECERDMIGWTLDATTAFKYLHNVSVYCASELIFG